MWFNDLNIISFPIGSYMAIRAIESIATALYVGFFSSGVSKHLWSISYIFITFPVPKYAQP